MNKTMRVQVIISMDVDIDAYNAEYPGKSAKDIRSDIKWSAYNAVAQTTLPSDHNDAVLKNVQLLNAER